MKTKSLPLPECHRGGSFYRCASTAKLDGRAIPQQQTRAHSPDWAAYREALAMLADAPMGATYTLTDHEERDGEGATVWNGGAITWRKTAPDDWQRADL
jgi:hypothetical protein